MLQIYAGILTIALCGMALWFFLKKGQFDEISTRRINILEEDGTLRMVISNEKRQHPGTVDGKILSPRQRSAGMIFFNNDGNECGGLLFDGSRDEAGMVYSVDQYKNDQVMQLQYDEDHKERVPLRSYGLKMWDRSDLMTVGDVLKWDDSLKRNGDTAFYRKKFDSLSSEGLLGQERLFLGKNRSQQVGLFIKDRVGRPRIEIGVDSVNNILFKFFDKGERKCLCRND